MNRTRLAWLVLVLCLFVLLSAMGWITATLLRLDRREQEEWRLAALEQNTRLALWRVEWQVERLRNTLELPSEPTRVDEWLGAPLASPIRGRFLLTTPDGLIYAGAPEWRPEPMAVMKSLVELQERSLDIAEPADEQPTRNLLEYVARHHAVTQHFRQAIFINDALYLIQLTPGQGGSAEAGFGRLYGYVIDWNSWLPELLQTTDSILADAELHPVRPTDAVRPGRELTGIPFRLSATQPQFFYQPPSSSTRLMLLIAWSCMLLPAVGVALLVVSAVSLNERRGAFVSAVTHELRTPLTTFCMYTEMLDEGMVPNAKRQQYLKTLRREAQRLSHLVENVLTYARIDRSRSQISIESVKLPELLERIHDELRQRSERADMQLVMPTEVAAVSVDVDTAGFERILVNLVDNACKYAAVSTDRRIHLDIQTKHDEVELQVRDHGPGVDSKGERKLFRAFSKSDREAAQSAAGVGLGLALSRRLALRMGGNLRYRRAEDGGACFVLTLVKSAA